MRALSLARTSTLCYATMTCGCGVLWCDAVTGLGQSRTIVRSIGTRQVMIDSPLDGHATLESTLGLMVSVGP